MKQELMASMLLKAMGHKSIRGHLLSKFEKKLFEMLVDQVDCLPKPVSYKKYQFLTSLLHRSLINMDKGYFSEDIARKIMGSLVTGALIGGDISRSAGNLFKEKHGQYPPAFLVISPTQRCNLQCSGCYAASGSNTPSTLSFDVVKRIVDEAYNSWGNRFLTISGGEPFLYKSGDKNLFDIWKKYPDMFFLVYTNGTQITKEVAKKLAELGNVTPAVSVEGFENETDERRGRGIHKKILEAFKNLRSAGVPFGISVTATSKNADILLNDDFYKYYFDIQGATYMWEFQLMPIGRAREVSKSMISPEQRLKLYHKWTQLLEKKYPVADFWNSGVLSDGCIAYARAGGYLYIDWNGNIMPCVFVPYYIDNLLDLFNNDKTITDAIFSDFFVRGREWQIKYGLGHSKNPNNWLMPCSIRDHFRNFKQNIMTSNTKPENDDAKFALASKEYEETLHNFHLKLTELTEPVWQSEYFGNE